jgi:hypothetical protein
MTPRDGSGGHRRRGSRVVVRALGCTVALAGAYGLVLRPRHLRWGSSGEEAGRDMPGDDLVSRPQLVATRALTIAAPPPAVWPWLVQMGGYTRAGWYSYDWIDNAGRTSDWEIRPDLQQLSVGDVMATTPDGRGFEVRAIDPGRSLVLGIDAPKAAISTAITLEPVEPEATRLVIRLRQRAPTWQGWPFLAAMDVGDFVMMRRMMLGIRARAERSHRLSRSASP